MSDRDLAALRGELLLLQILTGRALEALDGVDSDMLTSAPPPPKGPEAPAERAGARWAPANPTLDLITHPARSGLSEALTALRHIARGSVIHLEHHTERLRQSTVAWLGTNEETS